MKPLSECLLYSFVDTAYLHGRTPADIAGQLCDGGSDLIQLRAKTSTVDEIRAMAEAILPVTREAGVGLVINDHLSVAWDVGAVFCHLGQEDFFEKGFAQVSQLRSRQSEEAEATPERPVRLLTSAATAPVDIGLSSHGPAQAERAISAGAAYIAMGPVYATGTKPGATPVTLDYVRWAARHVKIPWFAIGGINLQNLDDVLQAGGKRICVVSAILSATDIAGTCQKFKERLLSAR
jgi:thiamine-phosphate pyrophosphorylase